MATVLITGANRGLGLEFTRQYAALGWEVIACARHPDAASALLALARDSAGRVVVERLDVTDHAGVDAAARRLEGRAIDVLLNNAGTMGRGNRFGEIDYADWDGIFRINVTGPMKVTEAFVGHVARSTGRKIVAISSDLGSMASNTSGRLYAYRASKAALNSCMKSLAIDLGRDRGLVVAVLHPGWVRTDMGTPRASIDPPESVTGLIKVIDELDAGKAGRFWRYDGAEVPW
ncbi:MAG: SDR family oxidoreductase [Xanthomonadales bacterium]|nr:SDR family oxidoreductase [Xanthomonadales bacterium]